MLAGGAGRSRQRLGGSERSRGRKSTGRRLDGSTEKRESQDTTVPGPGYEAASRRENCFDQPDRLLSLLHTLTVSRVRLCAVCVCASEYKTTQLGTNHSSKTTTDRPCFSCIYCNYPKAQHPGSHVSRRRVRGTWSTVRAGPGAGGAQSRNRLRPAAWTRDGLSLIHISEPTRPY